MNALDSTLQTGANRPKGSANLDAMNTRKPAAKKAAKRAALSPAKAKLITQEMTRAMAVREMARGKRGVAKKGSHFTLVYDAAGRIKSRKLNNQQSDSLTFGSARVEGAVKVAKGSQAIAKAIAQGQYAMAKIRDVISIPGVESTLGKGIPRYHADAQDPDGVVRVLGGKRMRGRFVDGKFKER